MKKIALVINNSWSAYNFRLNLARAMKKDGYEVVFIAPYDNKYSKLIEEEFRFFDVDIDSKGMNPINDMKMILSLYKTFKIIKPDIILNFTIKPNIYSSIVAGVMGIASISNITGLGTIFIKESLVTKIAKLLYKVALNFNSVVFFQNRDDENLFTYNNLVDKNKIDLLPGSGVDLKKFVPSQTKTLNNKIIFLVIARLLKDKGIVEYIEAIKIIQKKYKNVEFKILGAVGVENKTAISKDELQVWIDNNLVEYLGVSDDVQKIIASVDCVVLPSYREGTPRSLLEACAMEKPIITTNVVGCKEVVDDSINGYLCKVKDTKDLANKIEMMINLSQDERVSMGRLGRKKVVDKFDEKIVIDKYLNSIREIL